MPGAQSRDAEEVVSGALSNASSSAKQLGIQDFEISASVAEDVKIILTPNGERTASAVTRKSLFARVIRERRMGVAFTNDFSSRKLTSCLRSALRLTSHMPEDDRPRLFASSGRSRGMVANMVDGRMASLDFSAENDMMESMLSSARNCGRDVSVAGGNIIATQGAEGVANSEGVDISEKRTLLYADCLSISGSGRSVSPECVSAMTTRSAKLPFEKIGAQCGTIASLCAKRVSPKTEECDVVFSAQALGLGEAGLLTAILTDALSGMEVMNKSSLFENRLDTEVASTKLSLRDDPTLSGRAGSRSFDDEGSRTRGKWLIRDGVLKQFVWDSYYGSVAGSGTTGNAVRDSSTGMVAPQPLNLTVRGGKGNLDALISELDHGYLVWGCQGAHTSNTQTGDFSFVASPGLKIKNGEIIGSVQGAMVSGNVLHLLSNLQVIGNDHTDFGCSIMPSMTFRDVKITTG